ncbi:hypothetical protein GMRT_14960 [Giardia muris]|uniref:Uncharacterized protein n=1 Tax=Giardia muris TaxID=5742 RepID=A0A4Z1T5A2_GIAMU|nr:hypothetical protein GMRT_14960 [Giardia muris]|eukprot:TNJ29193.1 hypothetical protein GMRT_14960 [Giardia muris]
MALLNPFTQDPVTHPSVTWTPVFEATAQVFRLRPHVTDPNAIFTIGLNGHIHSHNVATGAFQPYATTGGQPTDIITTGGEAGILITDTAWNNILILRDGQVSGILDSESGILNPTALCYLGGTAYFADQTGLYSFSSEGVVHKHLDQLGITALTVVHDCIIMAVSGENCLKLMRPGYHPIVYASGFFGAFRLIDLCVGPDNSLLVATESISTRVNEADSGTLGQNGYLFIISCFGVPSACVAIPGTPTSVCYVNGRILVSIVETRDIYGLPTSSLI